MATVVPSTISYPFSEFFEEFNVFLILLVKCVPDATGKV